MEIKEITKEENNLWNNFVKNHPYGNILQSWEWGEVLVADGHPIKRLAIVHKKRTMGLALVVRISLPFSKSYLYLPRGPVLFWKNIHHQGRINLPQEAFVMLLERLKKIALQDHTLFVRLDPPVEASELPSSFWEDFGFVKPPYETQPKTIHLLDLDRPSDQLLKLMKPKTRYNIRLAQRKHLLVRKSIDIRDVKIFYQLLCETAARNQFKPHPYKHYFNIIKILGRQNLALLFLAEYQKKIIAANLVSFFGRTATYLHGASSNLYRNLMPTYLLQWEAILEAQKRGCQFYDLGGVVPPQEKNHPWEGISRFKQGFGGYSQELVGSWDLPYRPFVYRSFIWLNNLRRKIRELKNARFFS